MRTNKSLWRNQQVDKKASLPPLKIIAFDLNGVLAEANIPLCEDIKHQFGLDIDPNVETYGEIGQRLAAYRNKQDGWLSNHINSPEFILKLQPIEGAIETWTKLRAMNLFDLRVVSGHTVTNRETIIATNTWLATNDFSVGTSQAIGANFTKYKDSWIHQVNAKYLVEDSPIHAIEVSENNPSSVVFLLDKSYNKKCEGVGIIRISKLSDILQHTGV